MNQTLRLYKYFLPKHYELELTLQRTQRTFHGRVIISGHTPHNKHPLFVHAKELTIHHATIDGEAVAVKPYAHDAIRLGDDIPHGDHTLRIEFSGKITDSMHGIYPCYYEHEGIKKELLATQFEPHHAREVFPCIDEPEAKATFALTLHTEANVTVLSNTTPRDIEQQYHQDTQEKQLITRFETTPRMSTYLLAFVVGELHASTATSKNGTNVSVYSTLSQAKSSHRFALKEAIRHLEFFEDYFGIDFPLGKCDHIALPDFSALAMENWGLITYREGFLVTHETTSITQQQYISSVIAHELAHQWFGNLVTMRWWDDLWLNESFANLMQYIALDHAHPDWLVWDDYADQETQLALSRDQFAHVQPVRHTIITPDDIATVFDKAILYAKGSRLLRMAMEHIGEPEFRKGLTAYFNDFCYTNTEGADLWRTLSKSSGKRIEAFMDTWLSQAGLPVVSVESSGTGIIVSQHRFALGGHTRNTIWPIPLAPHDPHMSHMLTKRRETTQAHLPQINRDNINHFVTAYDLDAFTKMRGMLQAHQLSSVERGALLYETYLLTQAGTYDSARLFELLSDYREDTSSGVWNIITSIVDSLRIMAGENDGREPFNSFVLRLTSSALMRYEAQAPGNDTLHDSKVRSMISELRVTADDKSLQHRLTHGYDSVTTQPIHPDMLLATYQAVVATGKEDDIASLIAQHHSTHDSHLRSRIARALATSHNTQHLHEFLSWFTQPDVVKPQDLPWWFGSMMRNPKARNMTWHWLIEHWDWMSGIYHNDSTLDRFITMSARAMATSDWQARYNEFVASVDGTASQRNIDIGRDEITAKVDWLARSGNDIKRFIARGEHDTIGS